MLRFYRGLKNEVKDEIAKEDRPDTLTKYIERAVRIDNRNFARAQEKRGKGGQPWLTTGHRSNTGKSRQALSTAYGTHAGPMELDVTGQKKLSKDKRERRRRERLCFECGKPGHMASQHTEKDQGRRPWRTRKQLNATGQKPENGNQGGREQSTQVVRLCATSERRQLTELELEELSLGTQVEEIGGALQPAGMIREESVMERTERKHVSLSWTAYYNNNCPIHQSDKDGSG